MHTAIRQEDGSLIQNGEYDAIKTSSRTVAQSLVDMKVTGRDAGRPKTKQFFKKFCQAEWSGAITRLEELQPLLRLCASHWKAEHVLGGTLQSMLSSDSRESSSVPSAKGHKRVAEDASSKSSKKPRHDDTTTNALRNLHAGNSTPNAPTTGGSLATSKLHTTPGTDALSTATFSRKPLSTSGLGVVEQLSSKPQAIDPSYDNLISELVYWSKLHC